MTTSSQISVVVPVYNERDNIGTCLRRLWGALKDVPHEILVCYDFDEDTTLAGIAAMPDRPPSVRLVKNTIGRGAANALRAGFIAATGDVVVTTMADLSDPPEVIPRMAELMRRENLAVVAGSRYMRGGSQTGGPLLKRTMSRTAGVSLNWIAGLGTKDATSNFRAYSRRFLDGTRIESRGGFEIALELTVKAHLAGLGVGEVPSSWADRTAGESRFRLWKWLPHYLKWWLRAAWQPLLVWALLVWMSVAAFTYVAAYASPVPMWDDMELVPMLEKSDTWAPDRLWALHNEHRIPLPRVLVGGLMLLSHDVRTAMYLQVGVLTGLALACMLVARKIRGRTWLVDALFPLVYLHLGNAENLLMGFQLALSLPTFLVGLSLALVVVRRTPDVGLWRAVIIGTSLVLLPLCGGPGLALAPATWLGVAALAWWGFRHGGRAARPATIVLSLAALLTSLVCVLYFVGFSVPDPAQRSHDATIAARVAWRVVSLAFGAAGSRTWPWSGYALIAVLGGAALVLVHAWRTRPLERHRAIAFALGLLGVLMLAASIGFGRGGSGDMHAGFAIRYIILPAGALTFSALVFGAFARPWLAWLVEGTLVVLTWVGNVYVNTPLGLEYGAARAGLSAEVEQVVRDGLSPSQFLDAYVDRVHPHRGRLFYLLGILARLEMPPFQDVPAHVREPYTWNMFNLPPQRIDGPAPPAVRWINGDWRVLAVPAGTVAGFRLHEGCHRVFGSFGVPVALIQARTTRGIRLDIDLVHARGGQPVRLYSRTIDPVNVAEERGAQSFDLQFEPASGQKIVFRIHSPDGEAHPADWCYFGDVTFE